MSDMKKSTVAVIDYGMGNLHSVAKALEHVADENTTVIVTSDPAVIDAADRVLLPGVGAIRDCIGEMNNAGLVPSIRKAMAEKPFLAICVGIQSLMSHSEENGGVDCLNHFQGNALFFGEKHTDHDGSKLKVPHMGWNQVKHTINHLFGQIFLTTLAFILYTVFMLYLKIKVKLLAPVITVWSSVLRSLETMFSPCNFTQKKAIKTVFSFIKTSFTGMASHNYKPSSLFR